MAEDPKNKNSGSLLKAGIIASPLVGTTGYQTYKGAKNARSVSAKPRVTSLQQAISNSKINGMAQNINRTANTQFLDKFIAEGLTQNPEQMRRLSVAWEQAVNSTGAFEASKLPTEMKTISNLSSEETINTVRQFASNSSTLTSQIFNRFRRNWKALSKGVTPGLSYKPLENQTFDTLTNLKGTPVPKAIGDILNEISPGQAGSTFYTRPGFAEKGFGMYDVQTNIKGMPLHFNLPAVVPGETAIIEGMTQSSRRIARTVGIIDPLTGSINEMSMDRYFMEEIKSSIVPDIKSGRLKTEGDIRAAVGSLYESTFGSLESVPNIDPASIGPKALEYEQERSAQMQLMTPIKERRGWGRDFSPAFAKADTNAAVRAIQGSNLFAGTGSHIGEGVVSHVNVAERHLFPAAVDIARKPESDIRRFDLTPTSRARFGEEANASLRTLYLAQEEIDAMKLFGEGHAMGRAGLSSEIEHQWAQDLHLSAPIDMSLEDYQKAISEKKFKPGDILGFDIHGAPVEMTDGMRLNSVQANRTAGKGDFFTVGIINQRRLENNAKFHGDWKGLLQLQDQLTFKRKVQQITNSERFASEIDVIVSMNELKKDPSKFAKQVFTNLQSVGKRMNVDLSKEWADLLHTQATQAGGWSNEGFARSSLGLMRNMGMFPEDIAATTGAFSSVLGKDLTSNLYNEVLGSGLGGKVSSLQNRSRAFALGVTNAVYGGPEELRGAGVRGSLEPRSFEALQGPAFTGIGSEISEDFQERILAENAGKYRTGQGLFKTVQSMQGLVKPEQGARSLNVEDLVGQNIRTGVQEFIEQGGGWMNPGKGLPSIFVPNINEMESLRPTETAAGKQIYGDVASYYHRIAQESARLHSEVSPASIAEVQSGLTDIRSEMAREAAPAGKGAGAWMRDQLPGSRFLTAVDRIAGKENPNLNLVQVGLPGNYADDMFQEMSDLGIYNPAELSDMQKRFHAGEDVGGILERHPVFGEYSLQQVLMRKVKGSRPQIAIPEAHLNVRMEGGKNSFNLVLGPMIGLGGDKDADIMAAIMAGPDTEKKIRKNLLSADSEYINEYTQYQVRYQMLKAKKAAESAGLSTMQNVIGGARKLAVIPEWVPKLSLQMTESRRAVRAFGSGKARADAEMLLTWMEQTPISAKFLSAEEASTGQLGKTLNLLSSSLESGDTKGVRQVIESITAGNETAAALLKDNVYLEVDDAAQIARRMGINKFSSKLAGIDLDSALGLIASSRKQYQESGLARQAELLSGRGRGITAKEIPDLARMMSSSGAAVGSEISTAMLTAKNFIGEMGGSVIKNHKAIGLGFAATLALGAVLSSPKDTIGPGAGTIPPGSIPRASSGGAGLSPESVNPTPGRSVGSPSVGNFTNSNTGARISMGSERNLTVRGTIPSHYNKRNISQLTTAASGGNSQLSVNLRDRRSRLNKYAEGNK